MRRLFWLSVGATVGVLVVRRVSRAADALSPQGLGSAVAGLGETLRAFADDVRVAMVEHEHELMSALGVDADGTPAGGGAVPAPGPDSGATAAGPRSHRLR